MYGTKILIISGARHGKDTVAEMLRDLYGYSFESSSHAALRIFLFDELLHHGLKYENHQQAYSDRVNHRELWYNLICEYNKDDPARLAKEIMKSSNVYVGMRSVTELKTCLKNNVFDMVIGVYNPRKPKEDTSSNTIDIFEYSDIAICNNGTLDDLKRKVQMIKLSEAICCGKWYECGRCTCATK